MGSHGIFVNSRFEFMKVLRVKQLTPAPVMNFLPNKYNGMRRGVQVSFEERNPTRDTGTVQSVCGFDINTKYRWGHMELLLTRSSS